MRIKTKILEEFKKLDDKSDDEIIEEVLKKIKVPREYISDLLKIYKRGGFI